MAGWFSFLSRLFSSSDNPGRYNLAESYSGLRNMILSTKPEKIGVSSKEPDKVWGVLMETGHPKAVATVVALADGTVSLYFSNGGGIIGLGSHAGPKRAAESFVAGCQQYMGQLKPTKRFPLPRVGYTRFYLLTTSGIRTGYVREDDLGNGRHVLSPLFHKGHELISEVRMVDERLR